MQAHFDFGPVNILSLSGFKKAPSASARTKTQRIAYQFLRAPGLKHIEAIWVFPKIGVPQNGWFIWKTLILLDDLGVPLFLETPMYSEGILE